MHKEKKTGRNTEKKINSRVHPFSCILNLPCLSTSLIEATVKEGTTIDQGRQEARKEGKKEKRKEKGKRKKERKKKKEVHKENKTGRNTEKRELTQELTPFLVS